MVYMRDLRLALRRWRQAVSSSRVNRPAEINLISSVIEVQASVARQLEMEIGYRRNEIWMRRLDLGLSKL